MSEPENFITRWSRRKREAAQEAEATKPSAAPDVAADHARAQDDERDANGAAAARSSSGERPPPAFDPAKLPPIETITAESDIRAFLAPGVPSELTRAALRRAWVADPKIRDFVGLADYDWDFNTPGAIAGFGPLELTDELRRQVARMVGRSLGGEDSERPAPIAAEGQADRPSVETSAESVATTGEVPTQASQSNRGKSQNDLAAAESGRHNSTVELQCNEVDIAAQYDPENPDSDQVIAKRPHGSALPKG